MYRFTRRSSWGRWESTCFSNCGQSPPEITATLTMPRRSYSSRDISGSRDDLLSASVPSRSKTISLFNALSSFELLRSFRYLDFQHAHRTRRPKSTRSEDRRSEEHTSELQ